MSILDSALDMVRRDINYEAEEPNQDVWRTYAQSIRFGGDCEDMCLAIYETLLVKGIVDDDMVLTGGKIKSRRNRGEDHMVLHVVTIADGELHDFVLDPRFNSPMSSEKYFKRYMDAHSRLDSRGLYVNDQRWFDRDLDSRWKRYQAQLKIERGEG